MAQSQKTSPKKDKKASTKTKPTVIPASPHKPGVKPDAVDVVGVLPGDVHVDPELTEGHAGYEESGDSELTQHL
jgi:hypothetical protein